MPKLGSPSEKTRYDTSLGLLTKKFVGLLQSATDGVRKMMVVEREREVVLILICLSLIIFDLSHFYMKLTL